MVGAPLPEIPGGPASHDVPPPYSAPGLEPEGNRAASIRACVSCILSRYAGTDEVPTFLGPEVSLCTGVQNYEVQAIVMQLVDKGALREGTPSRSTPHGRGTQAKPYYLKDGQTDIVPARHPGCTLQGRKYFWGILGENNRRALTCIAHLTTRGFSPTPEAVGNSRGHSANQLRLERLNHLASMGYLEPAVSTDAGGYVLSDRGKWQAHGTVRPEGCRAICPLVDDDVPILFPIGHQPVMPAFPAGGNEPNKGRAVKTSVEVLLAAVPELARRIYELYPEDRRGDVLQMAAKWYESGILVVGSPDSSGQRLRFLTPAAKVLGPNGQLVMTSFYGLSALLQSKPLSPPEIYGLLGVSRAEGPEVLRKAIQTRFTRPLMARLAEIAKADHEAEVGSEKNPARDTGSL